MENAQPRALALALALAAAVPACSKSNDSGASGGNDAVNVGAIPIVDVAPLHLGKQKGFFASRHIDLTITPGQGGSAAITGVVSKQFQFGFGNVTSLMIARDKGLGLVVLTNGVSSTGEKGKDQSAVVARDPSIQSPKDLAGKTVSVNQLKNIGDTTIRNSVRKDGGDPSAIKFVELPFPDAPAALEKGQVDAAWVVEPFFTRALSGGARVVAWNFFDTSPNLTIAVYFTSEELRKENPDLIKRFREAMEESLAYADAHPDEVREVLKTYTKIPAEMIAKINMPLWPRELNRASLQIVADLALQDGLIGKPADLDALLAGVE